MTSVHKVPMVNVSVWISTIYDMMQIPHEKKLSQAIYIIGIFHLPSNPSN